MASELREYELLVDAIVRGGGDVDGDAVARAWGIVGRGNGRLVRCRNVAAFGSLTAIREALSLRGEVRTATMLNTPDLVRDYLASGFSVVFSSPPQAVVAYDDTGDQPMVNVGGEWVHASILAGGRAIALSGLDGWPPCTDR